jgi:hypothetical protein
MQSWIAQGSRPEIHLFFFDPVVCLIWRATIDFWLVVWNIMNFMTFHILGIIMVIYVNYEHYEVFILVFPSFCGQLNLVPCFLHVSYASCRGIPVEVVQSLSEKQKIAEAVLRRSTAPRSSNPSRSRSWWSMQCCSQEQSSELSGHFRMISPSGFRGLENPIQFFASNGE